MVNKRKNSIKNDFLFLEEERKSNLDIDNKNIVENNDTEIQEILLSNPNLNDNNKIQESKTTEKKALQENNENDNIVVFSFYNCTINIVNNILNFVFNFIKSFFRILYKIICSFFKISCMYFLWIIMHYFASHLYTKLCVPNNFYGFLVSPFLTSTPHCQGLRWIVYNAANTINTMWILIGTWLCSKIMFYSPNENINSNTPPVSEGFSNMNFYYDGTGI